MSWGHYILTLNGIHIVTTIRSATAKLHINIFVTLAVLKTHITVSNTKILPETNSKKNYDIYVRVYAFIK